MKKLYGALDYISKINTYILTFSLLFLLQKYTIGFIFGLKSIIVFNKLYLYEILFTLSSVLIIKKYIRISSPYAKYLNKC